MLYRVFILTSLLFLGACAGTPETSTDTTAAAPADENASAAEASEDVAVPERAFPDDSVYPLLVAEFALRRNNYKLALENYRVQAAELRDAGVSAHTTRLAQFLHQDDVAIESSQLWVELDPVRGCRRVAEPEVKANRGMMR